MKKGIIIYLIGVVVALIMGCSHIQRENKKFKLKTTYGDVVLVVGTALCSWCDVIALSIFIVADSDFWETPIE